MNRSSAKLQDFASRYTAAWCSQNPSSVAAFYSPGASLRINDDAPAVGLDAVTEAARSFMTAFPDLHVNFDELRVLEERVEYHWTLTGTNSGPGGTGNRVRISGFEVWKIGADGLIAASLGHFDSADYKRQLEHGRP